MPTKILPFIFTIFFAAVFVAWLCMGVVYWEFNPGEWTQTGRVIGVVIMVLIFTSLTRLGGRAK